MWLKLYGLSGNYILRMSGNFQFSQYTRTFFVFNEATNYLLVMEYYRNLNIFGSIIKP